MNQIIEGIGKNASGQTITSLSFEAITGQKATIRALCYNAAGAIIDIAEAVDYQPLRNWLTEANGIDGAECDRRHAEFATTLVLPYEQRFLESDAWNEEQRKLAGLMMQLEFGGVVYSVIQEAARRTVYPDASLDSTTPESWLVVAQDAKIEDPDAAFMWDHYCDTRAAAALFISQEIQKDVMKALMPGAFE